MTTHPTPDTTPDDYRKGKLHGRFPLRRWFSRRRWFSHGRWFTQPLTAGMLISTIAVTLSRLSLFSSSQPANASTEISPSHADSPPNTIRPNLPLLACTIDAACRIQSIFAANPSIRYPVDLQPGTALDAILPPPAMTAICNTLSSLTGPGTDLAGTYQLPTEERLPHWYSYHIICDHHGQYQLLIYDITSHQFDIHQNMQELQSERLLRQEAEQHIRLLRQFVSNTPASVAIFDREMRYLAHSQRWLADYRLPLDESLVGRSHYAVFPEIPERWKEIHRRCLAGETLQDDEDRFVRQDGTVDWVRWEIQPWTYPNGDTGGIIMFTEVITEQRFIQEEVHTLLTAEHEQRLIAETLNEIFIILVSKNSQSEVTTEILKQLERVIPYKSAILTQIDGDALRMLEWRSDNPDERATQEQVLTHYRLSELANLRRAIKTQRPVVLGDTHDDPEWVNTPEIPWIRSHITYPIVFKGHILGLILLDSDRPHAFSEADLDRLNPMMNAVAIILQNIRLYERSQQEIAQRKDAEDALQRANLQLAQRVSQRTTELEAEVSERMRAEALLRDSEERFRSAFTNAPIGLAVVDLDGNYLQINRALYKILGYNKGDQANAYDPGFTPEESLPISQQALLHLATHGGVIQYEKRYFRRNGGMLDIIIHASTINDEYGKPVNIVAQFQDITARKQAEQENLQLLETLQRRNTQLRTAAAVSTSASSILDPQTLIDQAVELIRKQFQYYYVGLFLKDTEGRYAVLRAGTGEPGRHMIEAGHKLQLTVGSSMIGDCVTLNEPRIALDVDLFPSRYANPHLPDTRSEMALPLSTPNSGCIGGLTVHSKEPTAFSQEDIAALRSMAEQLAIAIENARLYDEAREEIDRRMKAERALVQLNEDLERRVAERTAELAAANTELEAFAYSVSHDLRAPVRRMKGFAQAMLEDYSVVLDQDGREYLARMQASSQHMNDLIDAMLGLSRVTRVELNRETIDLSKMAEAICQALQDNSPTRQATFTIPPGLTSHGDSRLLRNVLENLLGNAWKFTEKQPHTHIEFGALPHEDGIAFFVRDNGAGFDMAYANRLFTAFQRLHSDHEYEGSGIGLATVQRIIHRHGGEVWAESTPGEGATFYFTL